MNKAQNKEDWVSQSQRHRRNPIVLKTLNAALIGGDYNNIKLNDKLQ